MANSVYCYFVSWKILLHLYFSLGIGLTWSNSVKIRPI